MKTQNIDFVHLHVHSSYSILDGLSSVEELVSLAKKSGMKGMALTDHGVMYGIKAFFDETRKGNAPIFSRIKDYQLQIEKITEKDKIEEIQQKIREEESRLFKPIFGCEVYCARRTLYDQDPNAKDLDHPSDKGRSIDRSGDHLILLAKNKKGYQNLIKLVSIANTEGFYYKPRIDKNVLEQYSEGLICLSACIGGEIPRCILRGKVAEAEEATRWFKRVFGDDFYLEIQRHKTDDEDANQKTYTYQCIVNEEIARISKKLNVKVLATNDVHFAKKEDAKRHDALLAISTKRLLQDEDRMRYSQQEWLKTKEEMAEVFSDCLDVLTNTVEVLDKVEYYSIENGPLMPHFPVPSEYKDADDYLRHLSYEGAKKRYGSPLSKEVEERLDYELNTIKGMKYPGYFLIVSDFISKAREMGISVGPGRGSAAGSLIAYSLKITNIDPIKYGLLFERFLNPDRVSLPDIDIDFDDQGRDQIIEWVEENYGKENVAQIITFGQIAAKSAIKDYARITGAVENVVVNSVTKLVPSKFSDEELLSLAEIIKKLKERNDEEGNEILKGLEKKGVTVMKALSVVPTLKSYLEEDIWKEILEGAQGIEGCTRSVGTHACGLIICGTAISNIVPTALVKKKSKKKTSKESSLTTQYPCSVIESTGLIKMDFLGLKTLSIIKECLALVKKNYNEDIDIDAISFEDPDVYALFSSGKTKSIFQFESPGMIKYLKELQPDRFELLIAMNALYRPGPMENIPTFIRRRHREEPVSYAISVTEDILKETYGVTVYQEQVMRMSRLIANFTAGQSDDLRSAMGKKKIEKMNALKVEFLDGGIKNGYSKVELERIWTEWEKFASYAFNKSHSVCYAYLAYQTAYLKTHYLAEFLAANMTCNLGKGKEIAKILEDCRNLGVQVLPPSINESIISFDANKDGDILYGLKGIKGVSETTLEEILKERNQNGLFEDIFDFSRRTSVFGVNKKMYEIFVKSGVFDCFGIQREVYFTPLLNYKNSQTFIEAIIEYGKTYKEQKGYEEDVFSFFSAEDNVIKPIPAPLQEDQLWSSFEKACYEEEYLSFGLSTSVLGPYLFYFFKYSKSRLSDFKNYRKQPKGTVVKFSGVLVSKEVDEETRRVKLKLLDYSAEQIISIKEKNYIQLLQDNKDFKNGSLLEFKASVQNFGTTSFLKYESIEEIDYDTTYIPKRLVIKLPIEKYEKVSKANEVSGEHLSFLKDYSDFYDDPREDEDKHNEDVYEDDGVEDLEETFDYIEEFDETDFNNRLELDFSEDIDTAIELCFVLTDVRENYSVSLKSKRKGFFPSSSLLQYLDAVELEYQLE